MGEVVRSVFPAGRAAARAADLGAGGGVPGLVLAVDGLAETWMLVDSMQRRTEMLDEAVATLGLTATVTVRRQRAEDLGRSADARSQFDLVVARGFGPPAMTAECAAPLLRPGGYLIVSEPPDPDDARWPADGLAELGLEPVGIAGGGPHFAVLRQVSAADARYPRRSGVPRKRPLF